MFTVLVAVLLIGGGVYFFSMQSKPAATGGTDLLACLGCGNFMQAPARDGTITRCETCGNYARVAAGTLAPIEPDFVSQSHVFTTFLPEAPKWPNACCVCCGPATGKVKMTITYQAEATPEERLTTAALVTVASMGTVGVASEHVVVTERYMVPHCNEHNNGARLAPAGVGFRSYRYFKQFVDANRAVPGA